ncbi:hypothetical protein [Sediminibacterium ginsengisoli]|uniref:Holin-X, holin superfamily III n=1 Tax=Sediminibacterium ginsengisoli TaxID=413434 RepID=A0A1T4Q1J3_9BACT|nr:hypothetical protein [Sediminibacterium ginsengisoli]SJZ97653.1 hypothetical protein SAMN04488132_10794 [Sediminibacterium ginsengisoli]
MEKEKSEEKDLLTLAGEYAENYYKLTVVNINKKTADISAGVSFAFFLALLTFFICMFLGIAAAYWIGERINSLSGGFAIIGGFYILLILLLVVLRKKLFYPFVKNIVVKNIYD